MKIEIKCRFTGNLLFEYSAKDATIKLAAIAAIEKKVSLANADLRGAYLRGADLRGVDLRGADLSGAILKERSKVDDSRRPYIYFGPIGADASELIAFSTNNGIRLQRGCFFGTIDEFKSALKSKHGNNEHAQEYTAALSMIELHFDLWKKGK